MTTIDMGASYLGEPLEIESGVVMDPLKRIDVICDVQIPEAIQMIDAGIGSGNEKLVCRGYAKISRNLGYLEGLLPKVEPNGYGPVHDRVNEGLEKMEMYLSEVEERHAKDLPEDIDLINENGERPDYRAKIILTSRKWSEYDFDGRVGGRLLKEYERPISKEEVAYLHEISEELCEDISVMVPDCDLETFEYAAENCIDVHLKGEDKREM